jgi:endonuclease I
MPVLARAARPLALFALLACGSAQAEVFINEVHYDDSTAAGDVGEAIEVVASAGESLAGYRIVLYNGASTYDDDPLPAGSVVACGGNVRIATISYPTNGLQNGGSDGIALVDGSGQVVQFLSYEGEISASNGPAAGMSSSNLPVSESNSTAPGTSLQLRGNGADYAEFTWTASAGQTFGGCNNAQTFGPAGNAAPRIVSTTPADGATAFPAAADLGVVFNEPVTAAPGAFVLACSSSRKVSVTYPGSGTAFTLSTNTALRNGEHCSLAITAERIADLEGAHPAASAVITFSVASRDSGGGYYGRVNVSSAPQLRCSLHQTIRGHTAYPYSGSGTSTWTILEIADEDPANAARILDVYKNRSYAKGSDRAGTGSGVTYNREHTWPNSLGFGTATGDLGLPYSPYTDTHMLYLSDTNYNADRGNKPYADCSSGCGERPTELNNGSGGGTGTYPGHSNWVQTPDGNGGSFEVWGKRKGDMARAVMYMAIRYEGSDDIHTGQSEPDLELTDNRSLIVATGASPAYMGLMSTLLAWHQADPPDAAERARNEVVFSFQGNRNPFIDHPEWATQALFTSTTPPTCQLGTGTPPGPFVPGKGERMPRANPAATAPGR